MIWLALILIAAGYFLSRFNGSGYGMILAGFVLIILWVMK